MFAVRITDDWRHYCHFLSAVGLAVSVALACTVVYIRIQQLQVWDTIHLIQSQLFIARQQIDDVAAEQIRLGGQLNRIEMKLDQAILGAQAESFQRKMFEENNRGKRR